VKANIIGLDGKESGSLELPEVFRATKRPDLINRAFRLVGSHSFQPKGRDPMAGERTSAETHSPPTGIGRSRIPKVKGERYSRSGLAAGVASVVKGRLPHPPRSEKIIHLRMNRKERHLATRSAIACTADPALVGGRGHRIGKLSLPIVATDDIETVEKTAPLVEFLEAAGLDQELERLYGGVKRNSGKARMRGRAYRERVGPLFVVTNDRGIAKAAASIPGAEVQRVENLSVLELAPGGVPGRLTIWTESAVEALSPRAMEAEA
jgi:large subunit ribosomal protein L4e